MSLAAALQPQPDAVEARVPDPRIVMIFAPGRHDARLGRQMALLRESRADLHARDIHLIEVVGDSVAGARDYAAALRQRYDVPAQAFGVLLIGRDGGVKLRASEAVDVGRLSRTVDAMPMRRREMLIG